jgi:DNA-binding response OmpR family regulator
MAKILVVEDDADLAEVLRITLANKGHAVQLCSGGVQAMDMLRVYTFDLIILDWMMPKVSGIDVLKEYRARGGTVPVLMLTAKSALEDKEQGLDSGADDYLTKPFHARELLARVRALLRRPHGLAATILKVGDIELDPVACSVRKNGVEVHLRPKVYSMLEFFMRHPDQVFSADALLQRIWLDEADVSLDSVRTHMKLLRQSVDPEGKIIRTMRNRGYILKTS